MNHCNVCIRAVHGCNKILKLQYNAGDKISEILFFNIAHPLENSLKFPHFFPTSLQAKIVIISRLVNDEAGSIF